MVAETNRAADNVLRKLLGCWPVAPGEGVLRVGDEGAMGEDLRR